MSRLYVQSVDMSPLNSLTGLTWLSLAAKLGNAWLASLRLGADMMVTSVGVQGASRHVHHVQLCCQEASGNKRKLACQHMVA
jgi:hypothetical protein